MELIKDDPIIACIERTGYPPWFDDDFDEENFDDEAYLNNIVNYVKKSIRKDPENAIEMDDVKHLVMGELEYEATLDDIF